MNAVIIPFPGNEELASAIAKKIGGEIGVIYLRHFPDGESYVRFETPVEKRDIVFVCTLDRPDEKILPLVFAAGAAKDLGANKVGLVAPYLAYMRQDRRFQTGEAITSSTFGRILEPWFDWLVTVDPHLHRYTSLSEIYTIQSITLHAAPIISAWIREWIENPILIGPDSESEQWVAAIAKDSGAPYVVLNKMRLGDRQVKLSVPNVEQWHTHTPVLVDDIISTARTMIETIGHLKKDMALPICIGVHAVFADHAFQDLQAAGSARIVTCNTIAHESNAIDISTLIADGIASISNNQG